MTQKATGVPAPELLETRFAACVAAADLDGMVALYAGDAVVSLPRGREAAGRTAIRAAFAAALTSGALEVTGEPASASGTSPGVRARAIVSGGLAMTTSTTADGTVRTQIARRERDGSWLWVRDGSRLRDVIPCLDSCTASEIPEAGMAEAVA
jgi:uncharacterized protein (TIGR02246 family)